MDPRHPELAVKRVKELIKNYEDVEKKISTATVSSQLGQFEREGGLIIQELCLVAPRIHEAMMQASRQRRHDLTRGIVEKPVVAEKLVETELDKEVNKVLEPLEEPKKKTTRKKKTAKKAED